MSVEQLAHLERLIQARIELALMDYGLIPENKYQRGRFTTQARESTEVLLNPTEK